MTKRHARWMGRAVVGSATGWWCATHPYTPGSQWAFVLWMAVMCFSVLVVLGAKAVFDWYNTLLEDEQR